MRSTDFDIVILGGGCAGLSLAVRLAAEGRNFCVVEPRDHYTDDRAWSFWRTAPDPFEDCVQSSWTRWSIASPRGVVQRNSLQLKYQTVGAKAFYNRAQSIMDSSPAATLMLGTTAGLVSRTTDGWSIETGSGQLLANHVIDTRPPTRVPTYGQFFLGKEIRTERPVFDPACVQLMHFRSSRSGGVDFVYTLPFARDRALVEVTCFAPRPPEPDVMEKWLGSEIAAINPGTFEVLRQETGALPMQAGFIDPLQNGVTRLGLGGGAARPSTGYAFSRIQAQAERVAKALKDGALPQSQLDGGFTGFMDRVFLQVLQTIPERGPALFDSLFRNAPRDRLERFLSGSTHPVDRLSIMAALPTLPFLRAALGRT